MAGLKLTDTTKIYVVAPANRATGGPELLHQLVFELRKLGIDALMFYYEKRSDGKLVHENYLQYKNPYCEKLIDDSNNILITPEVKTDLIFPYKNIQKVIWWLSIDNYYNEINKVPSFSKRIKNYFRGIDTNRKTFTFVENRNDLIVHFAQSEYATQHLLAKKIDSNNIYYLGDYLNPHFITSQSNESKTPKEDFVAYNPLKGFEYTKKLIDHNPNIEYRALENMSKAQVSNLLARAKVYIDFGDHPGKDRIPREAAICGACVITNRTGSANFAEDVPIPTEYKFDNTDANLDKITEKILCCFSNYEKSTCDFHEYREIIRKEQLVFVSDLKDIFKVN